MKTFEETLNHINQEIEQINWNKSPKGLYEPIGYILSLGGKRTRPTLALMSHQLYSNSTSSIIDVAIGLEIFHNFTLLHDDIMDKAEMRRGQLTVHKKWNDNTAILSGDVMQIEAYKWINKVEEKNLKPVLTAFSKMAAEICEGQQLDMEFERRERVTIDEYLDMIRLKTAVLMATACEIGGIIANAKADDKTHLYLFGLNIGMAFQLKDDLLDVYGNPEKFGKSIGGDIRCNKKTYLLITALNQSTDKQLAEFDLWINNNNKTQEVEKVNAITRLYNELDIKKQTEESIKQYVETALQHLHKIDVHDDKKNELEKLAKALTNRND